jgi:hypothetical protein
MKQLVLAVLLFSSGCVSQAQYGAAAPTRQICKLGGFRQELTLAPDFHVDRVGDDGYPDDAQVRALFAADSQAVARYTKCTDSAEVGVFRMVLRRIEAGSTRSAAMKTLCWTAFLVATFGVSSIYPFSEDRWLTLELDADATIAGKRIWNGQFTSFVRAGLGQRMPTTGEQLTGLMLRAQDAALKDLHTPAGAR